MKTDLKKKPEQEIIARSEGRISQKYYKGKRLCKVTFGEIYEVKNKKTQELFVCKQISKSKIVDIEKFNLDIAATLKMDHPSVAKLHDAYEDTRHIYLIYSKCYGQTLFDLLIQKIGNGEEYSEKFVASLFKQMIAAIAHCHSFGVSHKDIRPENFKFLSSEDTASLQLLDIGVSKIFGEFKGVAKRLGFGDNEKGGKNNYHPASKTYIPLFVPPELLQGVYDDKSDVWSVGVILYIMIAGYSPIKGETTAEMFKQISRKKVNFHDQIWKSVSDEIKDLLKHMLCDISNRYTAQQVLDHDWVKNCAPNGSNESIKNFDFDSFKKLSANYLFKKTIINILSSKLKEEEMTQVKKLFDEVKGEDETITLTQLKDSFSKLQLDETSASNVFSSMDMDGNGKIDFYEFLSAAVEQFSYFREEELLEIFRMIDIDGGGKLSKQEIKRAMKKDDISEQTLDKLIKEFDLNGDGEIDYNEFLGMMEKFSILPINCGEIQPPK